MTFDKKSQAIIEMKRENPGMKLKDIATQLGVSYGHCRNVWSEFVRGEVTKKGGASGPLVPFNVHGWLFGNAVPSSWYSDCPVLPSDNRNLQKRHQGPSFVFIIHKTGSVFVNPIYGGSGWKEDLASWLGTWRHPDAVKLFMDSISETGRREYAMLTPGVPKNYKLHIKGVGTFSTDTTPFKEGSSEITFDPGFERSVKESKEIANLALSTSVAVSKSMDETKQVVADFSKQFALHYDVLRATKETMTGIGTTMVKMQETMSAMQGTMKESIERSWVDRVLGRRRSP